MDQVWALIATAGAVAVLLVLVLWVRLQAFLALVIVAIGFGLAAGLGTSETLAAVQAGIGGTLGTVAVVVGLGALFGAILEASGGVESFARMLTERAGLNGAPWALMLVGFLVSIPVFFDVALIILAPVLYGMARRTGAPLLAFALPLMAGLAVSHAMIPPTPGPVAVSDLLQADLGWVMLMGLAVGLPAAAVAGPLFAPLALRLVGPTAPPPEPPAQVEGARIGGVEAMLAILLPIALIVAGSLGGRALPEGPLRTALQFAGHPFVALIAACLWSYATLGLMRGLSRERLGVVMSNALAPAGVVVLITGAGGAFKQVLTDTGAGAALAQSIGAAGFAPVAFGFLVAALVRVAQGSATVAMITAAGLAAPVVEPLALSPPALALVVVSIAAGATVVSHVNDSGFWLVSRYLNLTEAQTLKSWTTMTTIAGLTAFLCASALSLVF